MAYPGAPSTWGTWTQKTYLGIYPRQMDAATEPDGRLRLILVDANRGRTMEGRLYYRPLAATFRWQDASTAVLEAVQANNGWSLDAPYVLFTSDRVTPAMMNLPRRNQVATAGRTGSHFPVHSLYYAKSDLPVDNGVPGSPLLYINEDTFPYFPRKAWGSDIQTSFFVTPSGVGSVSLTPNGRFSVSCDFGGATNSLLIETFVEPVTGPGGASEAIIPSAPWSTDRKFLGLDTGLAPDNKDAYFALASAKPLGTQTSTEIRVFRQRKDANGGTSYSNGRTEWSETITRTGMVDEVGWVYPKILLTKSGEPRWVLWSDPYVGLIKLARRVPALPDDDPATDEDRRIGNYEVLPPINGEPSSTPHFALGKGVDAAMDDLDRLHVVWHDLGSGDRVVHYARENASGIFEEITLPVRCSQPPTLAIGPGNYPYLAYAGPAVENGYLMITAPPGLMAAYRGDYEDRDRDGRPGLIERAMGSSDTIAETGSALRAVTLTAGLATVSPGVQHFETGFQIAINSVRVPNTTTWNLADGNDTIRIQPSYSINGMASFSTGGFTLADEFTINGQVRYVTVRDTVSVTTYPRQSYRLLVTRIPGAP
jgi:hypothetical protein